MDASNDLSIGLVLLLSLMGVVATPWLAVRGLLRVVRSRGKWDAHAVVKCAAVLAWAGAVGMYTWGVLHLLLLDESRQAQACEERLRTEQAKSAEGYAYSFVPLRFTCRVTNGQTYEAVVPGYVNPVAGILGVSAVALTFAARPTFWYEETNK